MSLDLLRLLVGAFCLVVGSAIATRSDMRWARLVRRRVNRGRHWKHFRGRKLISDYAAHVQPRIADEYRIDVPTRSVP